MRQWFVGIVKPGQTWRAVRGLREQGYRVFVPKLANRVEIGRHAEARTEVRFPGYIFIQCEAGETGPIRNTPGMDGSANETALICEGASKPLVLNPSLIEMFHIIFDEEMDRATSAKKPEPRRDLLLGQPVKLNDPRHPAHGIAGEYHGRPKRGRATIMVNFLSWEVDEIDLEPLERAKPEKRAA